MAFGMGTVRTSRGASYGPWRCKRRACGRCVPLALIALMFFSLNCPASTAQTRGVAIVTVPALWVTPSTEAPLGVRLESSEPIPPRIMLLVRGLPPTITLSEGRLFGQGVWVVPLNVLGQLRVRAPAETSRSDLSLALVTFDGTALAETKLTLFVAPPVGKSDQLPVATPPVKQMTAAETEFAVKLLERGNESIKAGNIKVAQQFYQRAAERGLPAAAMALAGTYDPRELARMNVDVEANPAMARMWYEKARELGARDADLRLQRLP